MGKKQRERKKEARNQNGEKRKRLSGNEKKRIARSREKVEKLRARQGIYQALAECAASSEELDVLRASTLAQKHSTAKRRAQATFLQERNGILQKKETVHNVVDDPPNTSFTNAVIERPLKRAYAKKDTCVVVKLWDKSLVPGRVLLHFSDGACDICTNDGYILKSVRGSSIFERDELPQKQDNAMPVQIPEENKTSTQSIMAQFAALKQATSKAQIEQDSLKDDQRPEMRISATESKYEPKPIEIPQCLLAEHRAIKKIKCDEDTKTESRHHRQVQRPADLAEQRLELPACGMEQEIVAAVRDHEVLMLSGETGSGKSTQLPQFLYENGFGKVVIASPRRVACVTTAKRVARELGLTEPTPGSGPCLVGYRTRYESGGVPLSTSSSSEQPHLLFVTDGVLLQFLRNDLLLREYEVVIIDEAHERGINTDLLLGLLSRVLPLRRRLATEEASKPLRLVVMSASPMTEVAHSSELWPHKAPTQLEIPGRRFPVQIRHALESAGIHEYLQLAVDKTISIFRETTSGGILVFVTGRREVEWACRALTDKLTPNTHRIRIVPLYAALKGDAQERAFVQTEKRLIVVATNVAETSVTIPGITAVIDSGRVKRRVTRSGVVRFDIGWISQASAQQRAGRAGRTAPGQVYRLYSAAVFADTMSKSEPPEVTTTPLDQFVLTAKSLGVKDLHKFPMVTPLPKVALNEAHTVLARLGAILDHETDAPLTTWGRKLARLPVGLRAAVLLVSAWTKIQAGVGKKVLGGLAIAAAAVFGERTPFASKSPESTDQTNSSLVPAAFRHARGDIHARITALGAFCAVRDQRKGGMKEWCEEQGLDFATLERLDKLRHALARAAARGKCALSVELRPSPRAEPLLTSCIVAASLDHVARLAPVDAVSQEKNRFQRECAYELLLSSDKTDSTTKQFAYLSRNSVLYTRIRKKLPVFIVYSELARNEDERLVIHGATAVDAACLTQLASRTRFLEIPDPINELPPRVRMSDSALLLRRRPKLQASDSIWELPAISTVCQHDANPELFRIALARLLLNGSLFPHFQPSTSHTKLVAELLPYTFSTVNRGPATKLTKLLQLLTDLTSVSDLRKAHVSDPHSFRSLLLRCLAGLPKSELSLYDKALLSFHHE